MQWDSADEQLRTEIAALLNARRKNPLMQTGLLQVDSPDENTLLITRYVSNGLDAFGHPMEETEQTVQISRM